MKDSTLKMNVFFVLESTNNDEKVHEQIEMIEIDVDIRAESIKNQIDEIVMKCKNDLNTIREQMME